MRSVPVRIQDMRKRIKRKRRTTSTKRAIGEDMSKGQVLVAVVAGVKAEARTGLMAYP